jgi:hypothetical protein
LFSLEADCVIFNQLPIDSVVKTTDRRKTMLHQTSSKIPFISQIILLASITLFFLLVVVPGTTAFAESSATPFYCGNPIGKLQTPTHTVSILSCNFGLAFTIHTRKGEILANHALMDDLIAGFPDLAKSISEGLAGNDARLMTTK